MVHFIFCVSFWTLVALFLGWRLLVVSRKAIAHLQSLHQIPCSKCAYFTGDYRLKCTVNPMEAMSESAIGCRDFEVQTVFKTTAKSRSCGKCSSQNWKEDQAKLSLN